MSVERYTSAKLQEAGAVDETEARATTRSLAGGRFHRAWIGLAELPLGWCFSKR
jgi:hypothetical protein